MSAVSLSSPVASLGTQNAVVKASAVSDTALAQAASATPDVAATSFTASTPVAIPPAASGDSRFLYVTQMPSGLDSADLTYEALAQVQSRSGQMQVWEQPPNAKTAVDQVLGRNAGTSSQQARFAGLGSALLEHVASTGTGYRQTVVNVGAAYSPDRIQGKATDALWAIRSRPSASADLTIRTQSGATVHLSIFDQKNASATGAGIAVQIEVDGNLTAPEREALQALAKGFDQAMEGLTREPPLLQLDGLMKFDSKLLTKVELKTEVYGVDNKGARAMVLGSRFTSTADSREIELKTLKGTSTVKTDLRQPAIWGSAEQKARAVQQYLGRVDKAAERGNSDQELVDLFKSSFAALHGGYGAPEKTSGLDKMRAVDLTSDADAFSDEDQSLLTGLADFKASILTNRRAINPRHTNEIDIFDYKLEQSTRISGDSVANRGITQAQTSDLTAAYHRSLRSKREPDLGSESSTQNYYYTKVEDHSSTLVELAYEKDKPVRALISHTASQSLHTIMVENNKVVDTIDEPLQQQSTQKDMLPLLRQLRLREDASELSTEEKQKTLQEWNAMVLGGLKAA